MRPLKALHGYPQAFWVLFSGRLMNAVGTSLVFPFLTVFLHEALAISLAQVGLILLFQGVAQVISVALGGQLADRWGRRRTMVASLLAGASLNILLALAHAPWAIVALVIARGLAMPLFNPAAQTYAADVVHPDKLYPAYGLMRVASNAGIILGPMLGAFLLQRSFSLLFAGSAVSGLLFAALAIIMLPEPRRSPHHITASPAWAGLGRVALWSVGLVAVVAVVYSQLYWMLPGYLVVNLHLPATDFGYLAAENALFVVALQLPATHLSRVWSPTTAMAVGSLFYACGFAMMALMHTFWPFTLAVVVITAGENFVNPSIQTLLVRSSPPEARGRALALASIANRSGSAVGPLLGGELLTVGGGTALFSAVGLLAVAAAVGFLRLGRGSQREARAL